MMVDELLKNYSLEITSGDVEQLRGVRDQIAGKTCVSVTFLPGDEPAKLAAIAASVAALGLTPIPHISARRIASAGLLDHFLAALRDCGANERVFLVAGDPSQPLGPYSDALAIINSGKLADMGVGRVGIAGYPEGHPKIDNATLDRALRAKLTALDAFGQAAEIVTQFSFDVAPVLEWIERLRQTGIETPVRVGVAGPASVKALLRFAARCGVEASGRVLAKYGFSIARVLGTATPDRFVRSLAEGLRPERHGTVLTHLYPFGGIKQAIDWAEARSPATHSDCLLS